MSDQIPQKYKNTKYYYVSQINKYKYVGSIRYERHKKCTQNLGQENMK
jgi:hypothetical protein